MPGARSGVLLARPCADPGDRLRQSLVAQDVADAGQVLEQGGGLGVPDDRAALGGPDQEGVAVHAGDGGGLHGAAAAEVGQQPALEPLLAKAADGRSREDHGLLLAGQLRILSDLVDLVLGVPDRPRDGLHGSQDRSMIPGHPLLAHLR
jgi:hypothetical protein